MAKERKDLNYMLFEFEFSLCKEHLHIDVRDAGTDELIASTAIPFEDWARISDKISKGISTLLN